MRYIQKDTRWRNKQRALVFCSRGVTARPSCHMLRTPLLTPPAIFTHHLTATQLHQRFARFRHLCDDIRKMLPHHKTVCSLVWRLPLCLRGLTDSRSRSLRKDPISTRSTRFADNSISNQPWHSLPFMFIRILCRPLVARFASWRIVTTWFSLKLGSAKTCDWTASGSLEARTALGSWACHWRIGVDLATNRYMWVGRVPSGPSIKFQVLFQLWTTPRRLPTIKPPFVNDAEQQVLNVHTTQEVRLARGSDSFEKGHSCPSYVVLVETEDGKSKSYRIACRSFQCFCPRNVLRSFIFLGWGWKLSSGLTPNSVPSNY